MPNAAHPLPDAALAERVQAVKSHWRGGAFPDLRAVFAETPQLAEHENYVVSLAYEKFFLLESSGQQPDIDALCDEVPKWRSSVRKELDGHRILCQDPDLLSTVAKAPWPEPPVDFGLYRLVRVLGSGAFGRAYLAVEPKAGGRAVVVKITRRSSDEAAALGTIDHPNITEIHWTGIIGEFDVVVMPFHGTATLADAEGTCRKGTTALFDAIAAQSMKEDPTAKEAAPYLDRQTPLDRAAARIMRDVADALNHLRGKGMAHGDLKPSNVVLDAAARPHLIDFNLSVGSHRKAIGFGGTPSYMPPERLAFIAGTADHPGDDAAADVFALGVTMYEVLTGALPHPFPATSDLRDDAARMHATWRTGFPSLRKANPAVGRSLGKLVGRALAFDPGVRPSALELTRELDRLAERPRRVKRNAWAALGLVGLSMLAAVVVVALDRLPRHQRIEERSFIPVPVTAEDFEKRGMLRYRRGEFEPAGSDFVRSNSLAKDPRKEALAALAYTRAGRFDAAKAYYLLAAEGRTPEAWEHNNLSLCIREVRQGKASDLRNAVIEANLAGPSTAARFNSVFARYLLNKADGNERLPSLDCSRDLRRLLAEVPDCVELLKLATAVFKDSAHLEEGLADLAKRCDAEASRLSKLRPASRSIAVMVPPELVSP